ncbi:MAG: iron ABC transporter substrate-binding protein [Gammaproteobacteria bacterium]|nr:MAG: iron ABC transporter substrate-binding protein [Gammaproteobacteria bacterium]
MKNSPRFTFLLTITLFFVATTSVFADNNALEWAQNLPENIETHYPITINNGNREITFASPPERVVTNGDSNIIELMFVLGLEDKLIGYAGFPYYGYEVSAKYKEKLKSIPMVSEGYIKLQKLLSVNPDFFLSGFWYGLDIPGDCTQNCVTPKELSRYGINSYAISESLVRVMKKPPVSMEDVYTDIRNLGIIFNVQKRAKELILKDHQRIKALRAVTAHVDKPLKVFIYTGGYETPRTAAGQAMPSALVELAGAKNLFGDIADSWVNVSWEEIVGRNPDAILILEYGEYLGKNLKRYLLDNPGMKGVNAVVNDRIYIMRVEDAYTGPRAVTGLEIMAHAFYPELF